MTLRDFKDTCAAYRVSSWRIAVAERSQKIPPVASGVEFISENGGLAGREIAEGQVKPSRNPF